MPRRPRLLRDPEPGQQSTAVNIWPIQLSDRLPRLPIPLLLPDPDVVLDLGAVVRDVYERGAYSRRIDYTHPVPPPDLTPEQQAWVDELLFPYRQPRK
ncbi:MAG: DUF4058 family protein [Caldilineaceae bacterium]